MNHHETPPLGEVSHRSLTNGPVRIGVIGCGSIAYWMHLRELRRLPGARLVAAADPDPEARARAARLVAVPIHKDAAELFARPDIDAVVISAPNTVHAELARAAAAAGRHFYLEKPIALSRVEALEVIAAAKQAGIVAVIGFNRRCNPFFEQARRLLSEGYIGRIHAVQSVFSEPNIPAQMPAWKRKRATGGGALLDLGSHHVDLLRWFLDDEIVDVAAHFRSEQSDQDMGWLQLSFRTGPCASVVCSFRTGASETFEFFGEKGTLRVDRHRGSISLSLPRRFGYGTRRTFVWPQMDAIAWRCARLLRPSYDASYRRALSNFVARCSGRTQPFASLQDGLRSLEVILAAEQSATNGGIAREVDRE